MSVNSPLPFMRVASMKRMSPPTGVTASPVAIPGISIDSEFSDSNFSLRRQSVAARRRGVISHVPLPRPAIFATLFLQMAPICRSRLRTPASRV